MIPDIFTLGQIAANLPPSTSPDMLVPINYARAACIIN